MRFSTIDEVLDKLDQIIDASVKENNYLGLFAWVYRRTTAEIRSAILNGEFEDNARMEAFDVMFANYYLDAYDLNRLNRMISQCWQVAFDARHERLSLLQHILLGMNAHINLDLGVTAARMMDGSDLALLRNDFMKVNDILARIVDELQTKLGKVSPLMFLLDISGRTDEKLINFSMAEARKQSWRLAEVLSLAPAPKRQGLVYEADQVTAMLAARIQKPTLRLTRWVIRLMIRFEKKDIGEIIRKFTG